MKKFVLLLGLGVFLFGGEGFAVSLDSLRSNIPSNASSVVGSALGGNIPSSLPGMGNASQIMSSVNQIDPNSIGAMVGNVGSIVPSGGPTGAGKTDDEVAAAKKKADDDAAKKARDERVAGERREREVGNGIVPWSKSDCGVSEFGSMSDPLGYKVKCGTVGLSDIPKQIAYWISLVLKLLPSVGVLLMLVGAGYYMYGGAMDDKEQGKKAILYVVGGLVVAFSSWFIVDWIQLWLTGTPMKDGTSERPYYEADSGGVDSPSVGAKNTQALGSDVVADEGDPFYVKPKIKNFLDSIPKTSDRSVTSLSNIQCVGSGKEISPAELRIVGAEGIHLYIYDDPNGVDIDFGVGHKIVSTDPGNIIALKNRDVSVTKKLVIDTFQKDFKDHKNRARINANEYGVSWNNLSAVRQAVLIDMEFRGSLAKFLEMQRKISLAQNAQNQDKEKAWYSAAAEMLDSKSYFDALDDPRNLGGIKTRMELNAKIMRDNNPLDLMKAVKKYENDPVYTADKVRARNTNVKKFLCS